MKKVLKYSLIIVMLTSACREDIDLPLDTTYQRIVIEGSISTDTTSHTVMISKSTDAYGRQEIEYISNALVTISDSINTYYLSEIPGKKGHYQTEPDVFGVVGRTYTLTVEQVDIDGDGVFEKYTATTRIVPPFRLDYIRIIPFNTSRTKGHLVLIYGKVPSDRTHYMIRVYKNQSLLTDSIHEVPVINNVDTTYVYGDMFCFLNDNRADEKLSDNDTITIEMLAIDENYRNFLSALDDEYGTRSPLFSGPSANLPTNIMPSDKAVGYFAGYAISRSSAIYKKNR
ncbi:MAG: DUF4249 domain-containing protein [Bacteroidales bacterium]|nr:DUF4249 domain-containing protein [Bacteroidales bacterium]